MDKRNASTNDRVVERPFLFGGIHRVDDDLIVREKILVSSAYSDVRFEDDRTGTGQRRKAFGKNIKLWAANVALTVKKLPMQVGNLHGVELGHPEPGHAGRGEAANRGASEPACSHNKNARWFHDAGDVRKKVVCNKIIVIVTAKTNVPNHTIRNRRFPLQMTEKSR